MAEQPGVTNNELTLVASLITNRIDTLESNMSRRFDNFEREVKPKIDEHDTAITAIQTEREVERRWRKWTPPVSAGAVASVIELAKHAIQWLKHP